MNIPDKETKAYATTRHVTESQGKKCNTHILTVSSWQFESIDGLREGRQVTFDIALDHKTQMFRFRCVAGGRVEQIDIRAETVQPELLKLT